MFNKPEWRKATKRKRHDQEAHNDTFDKWPHYWEDGAYFKQQWVVKIDFLQEHRKFNVGPELQGNVNHTY